MRSQLPSRFSSVRSLSLSAAVLALAACGGGESVPSGGGSAGSSQAGTGGASGAGASGGSSASAGTANAGTSSAGTASAGAPPAPDADCAAPIAPSDPLDQVFGWASVEGSGVATTTGGIAGETVIAGDATELVAYAESPDPLVIEFSGTIAVPVLRVASNKTLRGVGPDATLEGGLRVRGYDDAFVENVVLQNFKLNAATTEVDGDGLQIYFAHHVWVDRVEIWDAPDGNLDVVHGSNYVTISNSKFWYSASAPDPDHRFSNLVGHSDSATAQSEDTGALKVTFARNWWADGVFERMPRVRFGDVHVFNNYYSAAGNGYCIRAAMSSRVLVEANYFDAVQNPHEISDDEDGAAAMTACGNVYASTTGTRTVRGSSFTPAYDYALLAANDVKPHVMANAGPR
jgi:pectate lyase